MSNASHRSYRLTSYNGFSHTERVATLRPQNAAFHSGALQRPTVCSICGFSRPEVLEGAGYIFAHLEDYRRPLEILPCCKRCHAALHARFRDPERWTQLRNKDLKPGVWFENLSMDPQSQFVPFDQTYPNGLPKWTDLHVTPFEKIAS
jgi:hypothetical protein